VKSESFYIAADIPETKRLKCGKKIFLRYTVSIDVPLKMLERFAGGEYKTMCLPLAFVVSAGIIDTGHRTQDTGHRTQDTGTIMVS
jgi:hypothetical protein